MAGSHHHDDHGHHHHGHAHSHALQFNRSFFIAIVANGLFVVSQIVFACLAHSTSLLADAIHNAGDVLSLALAWLGSRLLQKLPTEVTTYGMKKTSILAALANGILLVFTCGIIASEAMYKIIEPSFVNSTYVMIVASIGIVVNGTTALLFLHGREDLNIRAAFLHLMYDAVISMGVVIAAALIYWTGCQWIDPLVGLMIAFIILKGTWALFKDSFRLIVDGVPRGIVLWKVRELLSSQEGVQGVHDLHVWALSTQENALSVHLWMPTHPLSDEARHELGRRLRDEHHIHHTTIQVERIEGYCEDTCTEYL